MNRTYQLLLCFVFLKQTWAAVDIGQIGVCYLANKRGIVSYVCCADYEEKASTCQPCAPGYTSSIGKMCRPCPVNTYGKTCAQDCNCNPFQRCNNIVGCIESKTTEAPTTEAPTTADQTSNLVLNELQTTSWLPDTPTHDINRIEGLSTREMLVYSILSFVVLVVSICLCSVYIKYKRRQKTHTIDIRIQQHESMNQIIENNEQLEVENIYDYDEINEGEMITLHLNPQVINNDYMEVAYESGNSTTSSTKSTESVQNGYLNPYQPCVSTNDTRSSYEKLQLQTMNMSLNNDNTAIDLQHQDGEDSHQLSCLTSDYLLIQGTCWGTNELKGKSYSSDDLPIEGSICGSNDLPIQGFVFEGDDPPIEDTSCGSNVLSKKE